MSRGIHRILFFLLVICCSGCANITAPTGGKKDIIPPKMVTITPRDSLLNTRVTRIEMHFDEYITVSDAAKEVQMSPLLPLPVTVTSKNKTVTVKIVDSFLEDNTTYRLSFGNAIKDLHEGNPFARYVYTFSTGSYFDSLQLRGNVINAMTGLPDTGNIIVLYYATDPDSAIVRTKPKYISRPDASGNFSFKGLPHRPFRIYSVSDANGNMRYDGADQGERIAFCDSVVVPGDSTMRAIKLRIFEEIPDSVRNGKPDSVKQKKAGAGAKSFADRGKKAADQSPSYTSNVDSTNPEKRTFDITRAIALSFNRLPVLNTGKITLKHINGTDTVTDAVQFITDTAHPLELKLQVELQKDTRYILRLPKGFAKDTSGAEFKPARFSFRTWDDIDYGKIRINLPARYIGRQYLLRVMADDDSVYQKPVSDSVVFLQTLRPARYTFRIIVDKNRNGKWDTGDLFGRLQPEEVIPYNDQLNLKAGWENTVDFETKPQDRKSELRSKGK